MRLPFPWFATVAIELYGRRVRSVKIQIPRDIYSRPLSRRRLFRERRAPRVPTPRASFKVRWTLISRLDVELRAEEEKNEKKYERIVLSLNHYDLSGRRVKFTGSFRWNNLRGLRWRVNLSIGQVNAGVECRASWRKTKRRRGPLEKFM